MFHFHLPEIVGHVEAAGRHALACCHAAGRAAVGTLYRVESPRDAFRVALRQARFFRPQAIRPDGKTPSRGTPLLIHYHIFKNAGTSFEWALQEAFGKGFRLHDSPTAGGMVSARDLARLVRHEPELAAISSHQAHPPAPRVLGRTVLTSILIRDPIARIGSIYSFEKGQQAETPGAKKAKELDFRRYVEWRLKTSPTLFCNYQVYVCAGRKRRSAVCRQRDLQAAIIRLDAIDIVGTVQRYDDWLALGQTVLKQAGRAVILARVHHNQSRKEPVRRESEILARLTSELGSDLTAELLERNELDMCLHQVADALLSRRLAERGVRITLRDAYLSCEPASALADSL